VAVIPAARYRGVRAASVGLAAPLAAEDQAVQSMPEASPTKWHLAHTTWFFETMVLGPFDPSHRPVDERYAYLFNSYYEAVGPRPPRPSRGLITRPSLAEVHAYRRAVDGAMERLLEAGPPAEALARAELGLHHEQQHQELILTDIQHALWSSPLQPAYGEPRFSPAATEAAARWVRRDGGLVELGHDGRGFAFDNEGPRHRVFLEAYAIADRPVTAGEFLRFVDDGGYRRPELWLSDGWAAAQAAGWQAPLYWERRDGGWREFTLAGWRPVEPHAPVAHVSHFEADAYARWAGARLPTEFEWEHAAATLEQGEVWEWTASAYLPYPRFRPLEGALGEYNGKFMSGQMVLRGGSCLTPPSHARPTYRNFFPPATRWQMSGFRLARWD
jgi:ergothioneine biosynthesis protein EgtB